MMYMPLLIVCCVTSWVVFQIYQDINN